MAKPTITPSATTETFVAALATLNVVLPVDLDTENCGVVVDAIGREVLTVDINRTRPDDECEMIAGWIVLAVNTCGGFRAQHSRSPQTQGHPQNEGDVAMAIEATPEMIREGRIVVVVTVPTPLVPGLPSACPCGDDDGCWCSLPNCPHPKPGVTS